MSAAVEQTHGQQSAATPRGPLPPVLSLNRGFRTALGGEEAAGIGRSVAQIVRGDGWNESRASAVLVAAVTRWLGPDVVYPVGFYANGMGPVEVAARVGNYYVTGRGIDTKENLIVSCCERHRARFSQARFETIDLARPNTRFTEGPMAQRAANRLAEILADEIDAEIARVVLGAGAPHRLG